MKTATVVVVSAAAALVVSGVVGFAFAWSGVYDVGADAPHSAPVHRFMAMARERSIAAHSRDLTVPDLGDQQLILKGAGQYAAMCTACHLAPGMADSELRPGLSPQPPDLSTERVDPKAAFWAIKHGIKASAMPAWGGSHDDATMWSMVAFLQTLPGMTAAQYRDIVARAPPDEEVGEGGHPHAHGAGHADEQHPDDEHAPLGDQGMHGTADHRCDDAAADDATSHTHAAASNAAHHDRDGHTH